MMEELSSSRPRPGVDRCRPRWQKNGPHLVPSAADPATARRKMSKAKAKLGWRPHTQRKARKHLERARSYARSVRWILYDLVAFVRWRLLGIIAAGAAHILTKFAAMGVI